MTTPLAPSEGRENVPPEGENPLDPREAMRNLKGKVEEGRQSAEALVDLLSRQPENEEDPAASEESTERNVVLRQSQEQRLELAQELVA